MGVMLPGPQIACKILSSVLSPPKLALAHITRWPAPLPMSDTMLLQISYIAVCLGVYNVVHHYVLSNFISYVQVFAPLRSSLLPLTATS